MTVRVLIADDQALVRAGFRMIIEAQEDLEVVGEAADGEEAVREGLRLLPDVVLMDIRMPRADGIEATRRLLRDAPADRRPRVLILTTFDLDEYVYEGLRAGASGFLLKDVRPEDLAQAVRVVAEGEALLAPSVTRRLIEEFVRAPGPLGPSEAVGSLTERELEVMRLVARGRSNTEIASDLFVSLATVKTHVGRVFAKLGARDRAQVVVFAYEHGVVTPGAP